MPIQHLSSVHNKETSVPFASSDTYGECLRHSCTSEYLSAMRVYSILDGPESDRLQRTLSGCRSNAWFSRHVDTGEVRIASNACHLRWCPVCANARRNFISHEVSEWLHEITYPKFLSLTLKHTSAPLSHQIDSLYRHFRALRKRSYFKSKVTGGIWFFQVKRSKSDGLWHPHLHCLISGLYLPHSWIKQAWLKITFHSSNVDIRSVNDPSKAAQEVARYASTPCKLTGLPEDSMLELVRCMHGRRLCGTWGLAKSLSLRPAKFIDKNKWQSIGSFSGVMRMKAYDPNADAIWWAYANRKFLPPGITVDHIDNFMSQSVELDWGDYDLDSIYPEERGPP